MFTRNKLIKLDAHTKYLYPQQAIKSTFFSAVELFFFKKCIVFINKLMQHIVTYTCCTAHTMLTILHHSRPVHMISRPQNNKHD